MPLHRLLTVFTIFFSVTLCAASGTEEVISKHLDRDGMEFFFVKKSGWQTMSSRFDEMLYHSLWISRLTPEEKEQTLTKITRWKLFRDLLGLENAAGFGGSSKKLPGSPLIHNRLFIAIDPAEPGLVNEFFNRRNLIAAGKFLDSVPELSSMVISMDIKPEILLNAIEKSGSTGDRILLEYLPPNLPLRELLSGTSGIWTVTMLGNDVFEIDLPDRGSRLHNLCLLMAEKKSADAKKAVLPGGITVVKNGERAIIYLMPEWEKKFSDARKQKLGKQLRHALLQRMPEKADLLLYVNLDHAVLQPANINGVNFNGNFSTLPSLGALTAEKDGYLAVKNGDCDLLAELLNTAWVIIRMQQQPTPPAAEQNTGHGTDENASGDAGNTEEPANREESAAVNRQQDYFDSSVRQKPDNEPAPAAAEAANSAPAPEECDCGKKLAEAAKLKMPETSGFYSIADGKFVPAGRNNYSVAAFILKSDDPQTPVPMLIAKPCKASFSVLFTDGKIERFELEKPNSFRRITGCLQSVKMFNEKTFQQLVAIADRLDLK